MCILILYPQILILKVQFLKHNHFYRKLTLSQLIIDRSLSNKDEQRDKEIKNLFEAFDIDRSGTLELNELGIYVPIML